MPNDNSWENEVWKVASITSGDHLRRTLEMYEELGIETRLEEISPEECVGCRECYRRSNEIQYRVYVKRNLHAEPGSQGT